MFDEAFPGDGCANTVQGVQMTMTDA